jgi:type II secretory pathway pseudopilin PulG
MEDAMRVSLIILSLVLAFAAIRASAEPAAKKETKWQGNVVRIYKDQSQMDMRGGGTGQSSDLKEGRLR